MSTTSSEGPELVLKGAQTFQMKLNLILCHMHVTYCIFMFVFVGSEHFEYLLKYLLRYTGTDS